MGWTETAQREHDRSGLRYASDCTDEEWAVVRPLLRRASRVGRPRKHKARTLIERSCDAFPTAFAVAGSIAIAAFLPCCAEGPKTGRAAPKPERVYRVMKVHELLLLQHGECRDERRHDGRVAVDLRNTRWPSGGLEIT